MVQCLECGYLYVNPRPGIHDRNEATERGVYAAGFGLDISEKYVAKKVNAYRRSLRTLFSDVWAAGLPISWLDVGAGYGELVEALSMVAPPNSRIVGLEPMKPKYESARVRGLNMIAGYIDEKTPTFQYASAINIFSHIYDFDDFLQKIRGVLETSGEFFLETGDMSDVKRREQFTGELGLPDHVAFASRRHVRGFLERNGFAVLSEQLVRIDDWLFTTKAIAKRLLGRNTIVAKPYSSPYRSLRVRAKKLG